MKPTLTKQREAELVKYAREINALDAEIQVRKARVIDEVRQFDCRVVEIGQKLLQAKLRCLPGTWLQWLAGHSTVQERTAQRYMRIASDPTRVSGAGSIREALRLLAEGEEEPKPDKEPSVLPPYLEALGRVTKLVGYIDKHPLAGWPSEGKEKLREDLRPIVTELGGTV